MFPLNMSISKNKFKSQVKANFFRILSLDQHTKKHIHERTWKTKTHVAQCNKFSITTYWERNHEIRNVRVDWIFCFQSTFIFNKRELCCQNLDCFDKPKIWMIKLGNLARLFWLSYEIKLKYIENMLKSSYLERYLLLI